MVSMIRSNSTMVDPLISKWRQIHRLHFDRLEMTPMTLTNQMSELKMVQPFTFCFSCWSLKLPNNSVFAVLATFSKKNMLSTAALSLLQLVTWTTASALGIIPKPSLALMASPFTKMTSKLVSKSNSISPSALHLPLPVSFVSWPLMVISDQNDFETLIQVLFGMVTNDFAISNAHDTLVSKLDGLLELTNLLTHGYFTDFVWKMISCQNGVK